MSRILKKTAALFLLILMMFSVSFNVISYGTDVLNRYTVKDVLKDNHIILASPNNSTASSYDLMITNRRNSHVAYNANVIAKNTNSGDSSDYDVLLIQDTNGQLYYCMQKGGALMLYANGGSTLREFYYTKTNYNSNLTPAQGIALAYLNSDLVTNIGGVSLNSNNNREKITQYYIWKSSINIGRGVTVPSVYANIITSLQTVVDGKIKVGNDVLDVNTGIMTINGQKYSVESFSAYRYTSQVIYRLDNGKGYIETNYKGSGQEMFSFTSKLKKEDEGNPPKLHKIDSETKKPIEGVKFKIVESSPLTDEKNDLVTDKDGYIDLSNYLKTAGDWVELEEVEAAKGYKVVENNIRLELVKENGELKIKGRVTLQEEVKEIFSSKDMIIDFENEKEDEGNPPRLHKIDSETKSPIEGVKFKIVESSPLTDEKNDLVTDKDGYIDLSNYLKTAGDWIELEEIEAAKGYKVVENNIRLELVKENGELKIKGLVTLQEEVKEIFSSKDMIIDFENEKEDENPPRLHKIDSETKAPIEGVKFKIVESSPLTDEKNDLVTDKDGYIDLSNYLKEAGDWIELEEVEAAKGYKVVENNIRLELVKENGELKIKGLVTLQEEVKEIFSSKDMIIDFENERQDTPGIQIYKHDEEGKAVEGVEFTITEYPNELTLSEKKLTVKSTGYTNIIDVDGTENGKTYTFTLKETNTPKGYKNLESDIILNISIDESGNISWSATWTQNGNTVIRSGNGKSILLDVENKKDETEKLKLKLYKVDADDNKPLSGAEFSVTGSVTGTLISAADGYTNTLEFDKVEPGKVYEVTIKETKAPSDEYKDVSKVPEIVIQIKVNEDGTINQPTIISNNNQGVGVKFDATNSVLGVTISNTKKEINQSYPLLMYIKGTVFLDGIEGKSSVVDGYFNPDNNSDKGLEGIKVEVYDESTNALAIIATKEDFMNNNTMNVDTSNIDLDALEKYGKSTVYTDKDGSFKFYGLNPTHTYYLVFTYNGMRYAEIKATTETGMDISGYDIKKENASKATEINRQSKITEIFSEIGTYPYNYYSTSKGGYNIAYTQDDVEESMQNGLANAGDYEKLYSNLSQYMSESMVYFVQDCFVNAKISGLGNILSEAENKVKEDNEKISDEAGMFVYPVVIVYNNNNKRIIEGYESKAISGVQWAIFDTESQPAGSSYKEIYNKLYEYLKDLNEDVNKNLPCANLGVQYRSTFDMALYNDVFKAEVTVNGVLGTYVYDKRAANGAAFSFGVNEADWKTYYSNLSNGNVEALRNLKYNTTISTTTEYLNSFRDSDIHYLTDIQTTTTGIAIAGGYTDNNNSIYLINKVKLINQSGVKGTVTEIVDYYSNDFEVTKVYDKDGKGYEFSTTSIYNDRGPKNSSVDKFSAIYIKLDNSELANNESKELYVVLKMKDVANTLTSEVLNSSEGYKVVNLAEINGYKTANGYIDIDSIPGNVVETNRFEKGKYEDDESKTPTLIFKNPNEEGRTISGVVFEDKTTGEWCITQTRQSTADSKFDGNDTLISGALVQLIQVLSDGTEKISCQTPTTANGEYKFIHVRPGNYVVRFAYGYDDMTALTTKNKVDDQGNTINVLNEKSYNGESYENTMKKQNSTYGADGYWYTDSDITTNSRYSDAVDNEDRRKTVTDNFTKLVNENAEILNSYKDTKVNRNLVEKLEQQTFMFATTDNMKLEMEYVGSKNEDTNGTVTTAKDDGKYVYEYNITDVDFGVVERSRAKLDIAKRVSYISLIDSTGKEITGGTYDDWKNGNIKYVKWILGEDGFVDMEIDTELLSGATLKITYEITVKDNSEKGNEISEIEVVDYVTNNLNYSPDYKDNNGKANSANEWGTVTTKFITDNKYVSSKSINSEDETNKIDLSTYQTILKATFKPGETKTLTLEKNLSSDSESNFNYSNIVEIVSSTNTKGRGDYASIFGNLDPITYTSRQGNLYWDFIRGTTSSADNETEIINENSGFNAIRIAEDDSASAEEVIVTPPEGAKEIVIPGEYYIFGLTLTFSLMVIVVLLKKYKALAE